MAVAISLFIIFVCLCGISISEGQLRAGFYADTCPDAESTVSSVVREAAQFSSKVAPALLRLHFHDCFVQGCDGSILINNGGNAEKHAFSHQGVGGFEVIDKAKSQLENLCPGVVSCADIVALAARDAVVLANGPAYVVQTGRRDGRVSSVSAADNMPDVTDSIQQLKAKFIQKGLSEKDLVILSAAHTIGTTACFFMTERLYSFPQNGGTDPSINPSFLPELRSSCPQNGNVNARLPIDRGSGDTFDVRIMQNIRGGFAVLQSDAQLYVDETTKEIVDSYIDPNPIFGPNFESDFADSMVRMGTLGVNTGFEGEIRRTCSAFN
ncbi:peroxidase 43 [Impatiens glandulifera]|uniref:peroxidase 43 n=1 Tax=Impatiens glandulifera TaxID=253017 RepID=UPI001FB0B98A|nr:peroxidase 43 [Impatiens glandulifera]